MASATICKIPGCGKPRREDVTMVLCDDHCRAYWNEGYRRRRRPNSRRRAKITEEQVREIRQMRASGHSLKETAAQFQIVPNHVYQICARKRWRWVA